jgi:cyclin-dependent kinase 10
MQTMSSESVEEGIKRRLAERKRRRNNSKTTADAPPGQPTSKSSTPGRCPNVGERYEKLGRVGEGTYGIVYKARDKETNQFVALKRCLPHHEATDGFPLTTLREIATLRSHHPNMIRLLTVAVSSSGVFLVFDYCPHDLAQLVDQHYQVYRKSPFTTPQVKRLLMQLFSALTFLHSRRVMHRDLKLSNLLYSEEGELKLADFGLSRKYKLPLTPKVVSLWYRPPELLLGAQVYDESIDIWGAGCVMGELVLGKPLWQCKTEMEMIGMLFRELGTPNRTTWPGVFELPLIANGSIELPTYSSPAVLWDRFPDMTPAGLSLFSNLLHWDPGNRWTAKQTLAGIYFEEYPRTTPTNEMPRFHGKI